VLRGAEQVDGDDGEGGHAGPGEWWRPVGNVEAVLTRVVMQPLEDEAAREKSCTGAVPTDVVDGVVVYGVPAVQWRCLGGRWSTVACVCARIGQGEDCADEVRG
jgi:hypothetical protein